MAKMIRLVLAVAAETLADTIDELTAIVGVSAVTVLRAGDASDVLETSGDDADETPLDRSAKRANARRANGAATPIRAVRSAAPRGFGGRPKLYTPKATAAQIRKALDQLDGKSLSALMLKTIANKGTIDKATLRDVASKHGHNPESVDNVVWRAQKSGLVQSVEK